MEASQPFGGQCPRLPLKTETGTNPYYWTLTDPRGAIILNKWRLNKCYNSNIHIYTCIYMYIKMVSNMLCSHNCQQCACTASNAHVRLQAIEYLNISGLVIDFATSPVRTGNSFFGCERPPWLCCITLSVMWEVPRSIPIHAMILKKIFLVSTI